ncbi:hypothetical protein [Streptomyces sp. SID12488]|uniref:hypothetical protein n=1 Tax=Streptomyces sp. SID12488 TaxID=2706040 RepID=UPI0013D905FF|nr:hypothetical protein [Streptomyces sp. SID12488]NEA68575.1 hypothetical protein [Streptomyces sp. SID12488]
MTYKAVHAQATIEIANLCALNTYIVCGEIISLYIRTFEQQNEPLPAGGAVAGDTEATVH